MSGDVSPATYVAVLCLALGLASVFRGAILVASGDDGRFRSDPWVSTLAGCALILLGQYLLRI